ARPAAPPAPAKPVFKRKVLKVVEKPQPTTGREEVAGAAEAQPPPPSAPAAAPEAAKAKRTGVSRQVAQEVREDPEITESRIGDLSPPLVDATVQDVAAEFAAREPSGRSAHATLRKL